MNWIGILIIFLSIIQVAYAENDLSNDSVLHDPFHKPVIVNPSDRSLPVQTVDQAITQHWQPELSMTLRAGRNSAANVGGRIVKIGEKIDGYQLIEVQERFVIFLKQGQKIRLTLDKDNEK